MEHAAVNPGRGVFDHGRADGLLVEVHRTCTADDAVTVAFGVRNFENLPKGLTEMLRVLKPEGKLVILELSIPRNPIIRWCYKLYFLKILPAIGGWVSGNRGAYEYLPSSVLRFPAPEKFMEMMQEAGFVQVRKKSFTMGICHMYIGIKK